MAIETECEGCGVQLRVADEYAGRQARCPQCSRVYTVPSPAQSAPVSPTPANDPLNQTGWYVQTPEGQNYGPIDRNVLDEWVKEGRVNAKCQLRESSHAQWRPAEEFYPLLVASNTASTNPYPSGAAPSSNPYSSPKTVRQGHLEPHRGALILVFGILGFVVCIVFSPIAWYMGHVDIKKMDANLMDPEGRTITQVGMIMGMIFTCITLLGFVLMLFWFVAVIGIGIAAG